MFYSQIFKYLFITRIIATNVPDSRLYIKLISKETPPFFLVNLLV